MPETASDTGPAVLPTDSHVHSQWSWDALAGSMEGTCQRAVDIGLPAVAFTEHAQFDAFEVLAHIDYPLRRWPRNARPCDPCEFQDEYRHVLRTLAGAGKVLEVGTKVPLHPLILTWWRQEGGQAITFASDAHDPAALAAASPTPPMWPRPQASPPAPATRAVPGAGTHSWHDPRHQQRGTGTHA